MEKIEDYIKEAKKFAKTNKGKSVIIGLVIGLLIGILWKIVLITFVIMGIVYLVYKKRNELKDNGEYKHSDSR